MNQQKKLPLYFHTLRYLRPIQFYGRLWFRLSNPRPKILPTLPLRHHTGTWQSPARCLPSQHAPSKFRFLNQARELQFPKDWNNPAWDKLWLYNLHYFDDLNAQNAPVRENWHRPLIDRWIEENPPATGNGWEPYPLSLRIVNWIKWTLSGPALEVAWRHSLAVQAYYLSRRLEHHLLGNHLFANAKALVFAGLFFSGSEADRWLQTGLRILQREVPEQILADGGHFERSPMYHSIILEDLLDLLNLANVYPGVLADEIIATWQKTAQSMIGWLQAMCHPDGKIALFNDAAMGIAPTPTALMAYAELQKIPPTFTKGGKFLQNTGYIRLQQGPAVAILDVGEIGPDYLPGHAHADTLSCELSLFGQRVLVNSGTSCYGTSTERHRQRSTAAHNTVVIDGENSSEVWGGFRVARRARPFGLDIVEENNSIRVRCAHNGYRRLRGKPIHWREWTLSSNQFTISDHIEGKFQKAFARFHFHPAVKLYTDLNGKNGLIRLPDGNTLHWEVYQGKAQLITTTYHPEFGVSQANKCLQIQLLDHQSLISFTW